MWAVLLVEAMEEQGINFVARTEGHDDPSRPPTVKLRGCVAARKPISRPQTKGAVEFLRASTMTGRWTNGRLFYGQMKALIAYSVE